MLLVEHLGRGNPQTLVFLHGHRVSGWMWKDIVEELSSRYHCIVIDLPRCGVNREREFSIDSFSDTLSKLIQKSVPNRRVHLIGVSVGAQVALQFVLNHSSLVESMMLNGVSILSQKVGKQHEIAYRVNHSIKNSNIGIKNSMLELGVPDTFEREFTKETLYSPIDHLYEVEREMVSFSMNHVNMSFKIPVMIAHGESEKKPVKRSVEQIATYFNYTQRVEIPDGRLYWMMEKPDTFVYMLRNWLEKKVMPEEEIDIEQMLQERT